jgi:multidrug resistance efflux pump
MPVAQARLRGDLVVSPQGDSFVAKDPGSGRFFRLGEVEHFIARQLDGSTSPEAIRERVTDAFAASLAPGAVETFIQKLDRLGLLETERLECRLGARHKWWRANPLYLRLKAFDPDRLLDYLAGRLWLFFTPVFVAVTAGVIALGFVTAATHWSEIGQDIGDLFRLDVLLFAWLIVFAVTAAHEFAHGLTCKHFGGHVHEMGFLLIYFQLAFYCNVSDAWLFPQKSRRLWVTLAGPYFELFLWALCVLAWRVTEPGTALGAAALIVVATSGIKLFFNLNPLIKLDGYYLLSDAVGIPNLRAKAFAYVRSALARWAGSTGRQGAPASARERRIYLAYGLLAGIYSLWLLGYAATSVGRFLIERYQGAGFVLYTGLLMMVFRNPLSRAIPERPVSLAAWRQRAASMRRRWKLLAALAVILALSFVIPLPLTVSGEFAVLPAHNSDLRAEVEGTIVEVYADEGHRVNPGDPVARLSERDYRAELQKVDAEVDERRAKVKMLTAGPRPEEIELARKAVETARTRREHIRRRYESTERTHAGRLAKADTELAAADERLRYARNDLQRFRKLFDDQLVSRSQLDETEERVAIRQRESDVARAELKLLSGDDLAESREELAVAQGEAEEADGRLTLLRAGSRPEEIEAARSEIARLEAERLRLQTQLALVKVVSPVSGVITTPKLKEKIGQYVKPGDLIAEVHELRSVRVEIAVPEREIGDVQVGQPVVVKARAFPERRFSGRVASIAPAAVKAEAWRGQVLRVTTEIDNPDLLLKPEMTGNAKIICGKRPVFDLVTRRLARYIRVEFWSWW